MQQNIDYPFYIDYNKVRALLDPNTHSMADMYQLTLYEKFVGGENPPLRQIVQTRTFAAGGSVLTNGDLLARIDTWYYLGLSAAEAHASRVDAFRKLTLVHAALRDLIKSRPEARAQPASREYQFAAREAGISTADRKAQYYEYVTARLDQCAYQCQSASTPCQYAAPDAPVCDNQAIRHALRQKGKTDQIIAEFVIFLNDEAQLQKWWFSDDDTKLEEDDSWVDLMDKDTPYSDSDSESEEDPGHRDLVQGKEDEVLYAEEDYNLGEEDDSGKESSFESKDHLLDASSSLDDFDGV